MSIGSRLVLSAFVLWTGFVWGTRISNTLRSEESTASKTFSTVLSVLLLALAIAVVVTMVRSWTATIGAGGAKVLMSAAALTGVVWLVRVPQILLADHTVAFKVVHTVLGVVSVVLAALVWQIGASALGRDRSSVEGTPV